ncbi:hypothetical protein CXG81DRAFT_21552 [Caulochytrium protostelioides]|uniref:DNA primase/polymerase bifunctional N-terminal domain-containing protein n=1 Tax=Caulochytrium protostelioides TaxID=1555241 RepID=A0A4P9WZV0_9FUNG|nr:hypothetical protein CXG81DRAFT_21552 [Caulochytrium protostelioides]|eukprot:RKO98202.1 hypothetical protein CXG81DRAFT_21552 [Caulochytrium protostelioides]
MSAPQPNTSPDHPLRGSAPPTQLETGPLSACAENLDDATIDAVHDQCAAETEIADASDLKELNSPHEIHSRQTTDAVALDGTGDSAEIVEEAGKSPGQVERDDDVGDPMLLVSNKTYEVMQYLVNRGFICVPLYREFVCSRAGSGKLVKKTLPVRKQWQTWTLGQSSDAIAAAAASDEKGHGLIVRCGGASGVVVVDVDDPGKFADLARNNGVEAPLSMAPYVTTPSGGYHLYFGWSQQDMAALAQGAQNVGGHGFDIRGTGHCVIAPPTVLKVAGEGPLKYEFGKNFNQPLPVMPAWLLAVWRDS